VVPLLSFLLNDYLGKSSHINTNGFFTLHNPTNQKSVKKGGNNVVGGILAAFYFAK